MPIYLGQEIKCKIPGCQSKLKESGAITTIDGKRYQVRCCSKCQQLHFVQLEKTQELPK